AHIPLPSPPSGLRRPASSLVARLAGGGVFRRRKNRSLLAWGRPWRTHSGGVLLASLPEQRKGGLARRRNPLCSTDCAAGKSRMKAAASPPPKGFAGSNWQSVASDFKRPD